MSKFERVKPINTKTANGKEYRDEYTFGKVHVDEIPNDLSVPDGVSFASVGGVALWKYEEKLLVTITESGPFIYYNRLGEEAENQAYFALSYLADKGYVSAWRKKSQRKN